MNCTEVQFDNARRKEEAMQKRAVFYVDEDMKSDIDAIKKDEFYDKSYSDLYRYLISEAIKARKGQN